VKQDKKSGGGGGGGGGGNVDAAKGVAGVMVTCDSGKERNASREMLNWLNEVGPPYPPITPTSERAFYGAVFFWFDRRLTSCIRAQIPPKQVSNSSRSAPSSSLSIQEIDLLGGEKDSDSISSALV
jgi:hypothetical protein